jgi:hypothetical protein
LNKTVVLSCKIRVFFEAEDLRDMGEAWGGLAENFGGEERYKMRSVGEGKK